MICFSQIHESGSDLCHFQAEVLIGGVQFVYPLSATVSFKDPDGGSSIILHPREGESLQVVFDGHVL